MKVKNALLLFVFVMLIMTLPSACSFLGIGCPKPLSYFDIDGIALSNLEFTNTGLNPWKIVGNNKSIRWDTYLLRVDFKATYYAENKKSGADLYALSCVEDGYLGSKTGVDTLYFITLTDFNNTYQKNDTLNNAVVLNYWTSEPSDFQKFFPITQYIAENRNTIKRSYFEIKLTEAPLNPLTDAKFKIIYSLKNGSRFEKISDNVSLTNL